MDPVSGLPDLRYFLLAFDSKVALARRTLQPVSVVLMQIDDWDRKTPDHRRKGPHCPAGAFPEGSVD